jgi:uncharacterized protein YxeA
MNWCDLNPMMKILIIIVIVIIVIVIIILIIYFIKRHKSKESYTTLLNNNATDLKNDPLQNYVSSWINSVKQLYSNSGEKYMESRTMKNFNNYTYLDKNAIITGMNKY